VVFVAILISELIVRVRGPGGVVRGAEIRAIWNRGVRRASKRIDPTFGDDDLTHDEGAQAKELAAGLCSAGEVKRRGEGEETGPDLQN
jgi:hypothetical protein